MQRTPLDALVTRACLKEMEGNTFLLDHFIENHANLGQTKNVCAKVSVQMSDQIDQLVRLLGINKRSFLEAAFADAILKAEAIIEAEGLWAYLEETRRSVAEEVA